MRHAHLQPNASSNHMAPVEQFRLLEAEHLDEQSDTPKAAPTASITRRGVLPPAIFLLGLAAFAAHAYTKDGSKQTLAAGQPTAMWADRNRSLTSYNCQKRTQTFKYFGTAPACTASKSDCDHAGMDYEDSGSDIDGGASCWSGTKVKCSAWHEDGYDDKCNPECSQKFTTSLVGTAPLCKASACDCIRADMIPVKPTDDYVCPCEHSFDCLSGGSKGSKCVTGTKFVCVKAKELGHVSSQAAKDDCTKQDSISASVNKEMMKTVQEMAKAGASVAAASR